MAGNGRADAGDDGSIDGEICGERGGKYLAGLGVVGVQLVGGLDQDFAAGRERDHLRGLRTCRRLPGHWSGEACRPQRRTPARGRKWLGAGFVISCALFFPSALPQHDARDSPEQYNRKFAGFQLLIVAADCFLARSALGPAGVLTSGELQEKPWGGFVASRGESGLECATCRMKRSA